MTITGKTTQSGTPAGFMHAAFASALAVGLLLADAQHPSWSDSNDWIQDEALRDDNRSRAEVRAQRQLVRDALRAKLEPEYRSNLPYVSEGTIAGLNAAIARYRAIVQAGGWPAVPQHTMRLNDSGGGVAELRRRLWMTGDLRSKPRRSRGFDVELQEAVARFQIRNGLRISGFVDIRTRRALNVSAHERLRQLETNLARITELMKINKAKRYVLVNVPAYDLQAVDGGET